MSLTLFECRLFCGAYFRGVAAAAVKRLFSSENIGPGALYIRVSTLRVCAARTRVVFLSQLVAKLAPGDFIRDASRREMRRVCKSETLPRMFARRRRLFFAASDIEGPQTRREGPVNFITQQCRNKRDRGDVVPGDGSA